MKEREVLALVFLGLLVLAYVFALNPPIGLR